MNYLFVAFGSLEYEYLIGNVGLMLVINYNRRLPKSRLTDSFFLEVVRQTRIEMNIVATADTLAKDQNSTTGRKAQLLLSATITVFELMKDSDLIWSIEDDSTSQTCESMLNIVKDCNL